MSYGPPPVDPYASPTHSGFNPPPSTPMNQLAIGSLVAGIAGLGSSVIGMCCCPLLGLPLPAIAIGLGIFALRDPRTDANGRIMAIIGLACGGIGIVISFAFTIFSLVGMGIGALQPNPRPPL